MEIKNQQFGNIEYTEDSIIKFDEGLLGFEDLTSFLIVNDENGIFSWLTSVDQPEIIFPILSIKLLQEDYDSNVEENFEPFGIVRLDKKPEDITINLKAPVFIDLSDKKGFQKILDKEEYPVSYPLFIKN